MRFVWWFGLNLGKHNVTAQSYQNHTLELYKYHIKIMPQNHWRKPVIFIAPKPTVPNWLFLWLLSANSLGSLKKAFRSQTIPKPFQNHIEIVTPNSRRIKFTSSKHIKTYQNHIQIIKTNNPEFGFLKWFRGCKAVAQYIQRYPHVAFALCPLYLALLKRLFSFPNPLRLVNRWRNFWRLRISKSMQLQVYSNMGISCNGVTPPNHPLQLDFSS